MAGYGVAREHERPALGAILQEAFGFRADYDEWFRRAGYDNIRVLRDGNQVVAGLLFIPMGQFFGGKSVPTVGVAGVGVPLAGRGRGLATTLMRRAMGELCKRGVALSTLYPASVPLYRLAGYEIAGGLWRTSMRGRDLVRADRPLRVRPYEEGDEKQVRALYRDYASNRNGWLDRVDYIWQRTRREEEGIAAVGHVLGDEGRIEGYVFVRHARTPAGFDMTSSDMAARTPAALRAIMTYLADHRSLAGEVSWRGGVDDPWTMLAEEHHYDVRLHHHWMLRVCNVAAALEARGYPAGADLSLDLQVRDSSLRAGSGSFRLEVADGVGHVKPRKSGGLSLDERTLAALYSGQLSAKALVALGRIDGPTRMIERAQTLFAGPPPSMPDFF
jgi:predicted acetyltransferase